MGWLTFGVLQIAVIVSGIRREQRERLWSWSKFVFALAFAGLEFIILMLPYYAVDQHGPRFVPVLVWCCVLAAVNFIWFIIVCRRWRLPDGRTSLEAYRDADPREPHP